MAITPPSVSVVIAARNEQPAILDATLRGLLETCRGHLREIIVVDDASRIPIRSAYPQVQVQRNAAPLGVDRARRLGCDLASGEVLVIMDAHMTFNPDWLEHMLDYADPGSLLCAAWMNYARTRTQSWGCDLVWKNGFKFAARTRQPTARIVEVALVMGACYMVHRHAYEALGGFSPVFRVWGMSEQDISIRAWMAGLKVKCVTRAGVGHLDRDANPNPVFGEYVLYNQLALIHTVFEEPTIPLLQDFIAPLPPQVGRWLEQTDVSAWRTEVQSRRQWSDARFFDRFVRKNPLHFDARVRLKRGHFPVGKLLSAVRREEAELIQHWSHDGVLTQLETKPHGQEAIALLAQPKEPSSEQAPGHNINGPASITIQAFGISMHLQIAQTVWLPRLLASLPWSWKRCSSPHADISYTLKREVQHDGAEACEYYALYYGRKRLALTTEFDDIPDALQSSMESELVKGVKSLVFVQAGVVGWKRKAILILGNALTGKRALVAALVRAGADYYSDTFAIFNAQSRVRPYAKPLQLADPNGGLAPWPITAPGSIGGTQTLPVGLVVMARYQPGRSWRPRRLSPPEALTHLLCNALNRRQNGKMVFEILGEVAASAITLKGCRGDAEETAWQLLRILDKRSPADI